MAGYLSVSEALRSNMPYAKLINKHGHETEVNSDKTQAVMKAHIGQIQAGLVVNLNDADLPIDAYPILGMNSYIICLFFSTEVNFFDN